MKRHFAIKHRTLRFNFLPPLDMGDSTQINIYLEDQGIFSSFGFHFRATEEDTIALALLHKAIGTCLSIAQPGYLDPLPDGDHNEVDAMKLDYEVNRLWREGNQP